MGISDQQRAGDKMREGGVVWHRGGQSHRHLRPDQAGGGRFCQTARLHLDPGIKSLAAKESMKTLAFEVAEQLGAGSGGWELEAPIPDL